MATQTGIHSSRHRRFHRPIATISATTVMTSTVTGNQPPSKESRG